MDILGLGSLNFIFLINKVFIFDKRKNIDERR